MTTTEKTTADKNDMGADITETADNEIDDGDGSRLPVDRGWAWVVLAGAMFEAFIFGGLGKSYGIFFVEYQNKFGSSASETTIMSTIQNIVVSATGILVMSIGMNNMSARTSICIGAVISCASYIASAFAEDIRILNVTVGVLTGGAASMIFLPVMATIGVYFNKRRGLANSLVMSGSSLGGLVFGPAYTLMFDNFGYKGAMLITSAFLLNILITGMLMRPPEFYTKHRSRTNTHINSSANGTANNVTMEKKYISNGAVDKMTGEVESISNVYIHSNITLNSSQSIETAEIKDSVETVDEYKNSAAAEKQKLMRAFSDPPLLETDVSMSPKNLKRPPNLRHLNYTRTVSHDPETSKGGEFPSPRLQRARANTSTSHMSLRKRTLSQLSHASGISGVVDSICQSKVAIYSSSDVVCGSMASLYMKDKRLDVIKIKEVVDDDINILDKGCCISFKRKMSKVLGSVFDVKLLTDPVFIHYMCMAFVCLPGTVMTNSYIIPYSKDIGISNQQRGVLLSVQGCMDLISRICVGVVADKGWLRPTTMLAVASAIMAIMCNIIRLFTSYWELMGFVIIQGSLGGVYIALFAVILVEHIGMERFKSSLGFTSMCHGLANAAFFPLTGLLRDITGSYYWTFHMIGGLLILGTVLASTLPLTHRRSKPTAITK